MDHKYLELIKIRSSQINGCAYCIEIHTKDALKNGIKQEEIFALSAWWESPRFDEKDPAAERPLFSKSAQVGHGGTRPPDAPAARVSLACRATAANHGDLNADRLRHRLAEPRGFAAGDLHRRRGRRFAAAVPP